MADVEEGGFVYVPVTPSVLRWARVTMNWDEETAAKRIDIAVEALRAWEAGTAQPTESKLRLLARKYRRPMLLFLAPTPPDEPPLPHDFRTVKGRPTEVPSSVIVQIRLARERRQFALELLDAFHEPAPQFDFRLTRRKDCEEAGAALRNALKAPPVTSARWGQKVEDAYATWRSLAEASGVLVFQAPDLAAPGISGFSIADHPLPVAVVSGGDAYTRRIFTLLHELSHIALRGGGICGEQLHDPIERFCNRVTAAALMPQSEVEALYDPIQQSPLSAIRDMARRFHVSPEAMAIRLVDLELLSPYEYEAIRPQLQASVVPKPNGGSYIPIQLNRCGATLARLSADAYAGDYITADDLHAMTGFRPNHLPEILLRLERRS